MVGKIGNAKFGGSYLFKTDQKIIKIHSLSELNAEKNEYNGDLNNK